jgi:transposase
LKRLLDEAGTGLSKPNSWRMMMMMMMMMMMIINILYVIFSKNKKQRKVLGVLNCSQLIDM